MKKLSKLLSLILTIALVGLFANCKIVEFNTPSNATAGSTIKVDCLIKNTLGDPITGEVTFILSYDSYYDPSDLILATGSRGEIGDGQSVRINANLKIPDNLYSDNYWLIAKTTFDVQVRPIRIEGQNTNGIDIVPCNLFTEGDTKEASPEDILSIYYTLRNYGRFNSGNFEVVYILSKDNTPGFFTDYYLGKQTTNVNGQSNKEQAFELKIPTDIPAGGYYLILMTDASNQVAELNEDNNLIIKYLNIKAKNNLVSEEEEDMTALIKNALQETPVLLHKQNALLVQMEELALKEGITIFPSPATDITNLTFSLPKPTDFKVNLYDLAGKQLQSFSFQGVNGEFSKQIDVSQLIAGTYLIQVKTANKQFVKKIVVE